MNQNIVVLLKDTAFDAEHMSVLGLGQPQYFLAA
jgi:hypothetical protein